MTKIQWTQKTWNPITGCTPIATGCKHCYAKEMHRRLRAMGQKKYSEPFDVVRCHPEELEKPLHWRKPRMVFPCSMSDLFHPDVPDEFIAAVFGVMAACPQHTFQVLTKRIERVPGFFRWAVPDDGGIPPNMEKLDNEACLRIEACYIIREENMVWPLPNVWLGASASTQEDLKRVWPDLREVPASVRFLSLEPLLGPIHLVDITREQLQWCIVGAESGPHRRECKTEWVRSIVDQCKADGIAVFIKQIHINGRLSKDMSEWPADLRVREMPKLAHGPRE